MKFLKFDDQYMRRLAAEDTEVQDHFCSYFGALLRLKLRSRLRLPQAAEDVRQETFKRVLQALRKDGGLRQPERLGAFVNKVCNNVLLETFRGATKHPAPPDEPPEQSDPAMDQESDFVTAERKAAVARVLAALSPKDRELLKMIFFEERDKDEICKEMNVTAEYLRVLLHRAKTRFRDLVQKSNIAAF
jgi:RNA polymerase sigma-70 factor (ECF subfamily)